MRTIINEGPKLRDGLALEMVKFFVEGMGREAALGPTKLVKGLLELAKLVPSLAV